MDLLQTQLPATQGMELEGLATTLQEAVEKLRTLIVALTPPDLGDGLGVALRDLAEGIFVGTRATINLIGGPHVNLSPPTAVCTYRVLREALVNARKHARAANITVCLEENADTGGRPTVRRRDRLRHLRCRTRTPRPGDHACPRPRRPAAPYIDSTPGAGTTVGSRPSRNTTRPDPTINPPKRPHRHGPKTADTSARASQPRRLRTGNYRSANPINPSVDAARRGDGRAARARPISRGIRVNRSSCWVDTGPGEQWATARRCAAVGAAPDAARHRSMVSACLRRTRS